MALGVASVLTGGALAVILAGAFWGALIGGALGGIMGGITSAMSGGSFLEGFADGMLSGTITGAITGAASAGIGLAGQAVGKSISCLSKLGKAIKITSKVTNVLSDCMDGFDMLTMAISLFDPDNPLVKFNNMLQSSVAYNIFSTGVGLLASFTGGATTTMKCFVAGTMILTAGGLVAIENIKAGDKVISRNPETFEVEEKTVVETYVRETTELVRLKINGEIIKTTPDHPFYVKDVGFVGAGELYIGDKLLDSKGNILLVEDMKLETTEIPTPVYNFQVEDFHTYHVGENGIWVHNAEYSQTAFKQTKFNSSYESRVNKTPGDTNDYVEFKNKNLRGESTCTLKPPPDPELKSILDDAGIDGIEYKNAVPDFSPVSKLELDGIDMTHGRTGRNGSYTQANKKFAQMLNDSPDLANDFGIKPKNGKTFTASDISEYMQNNKLTWHELNDLTTIQMVPTKVNSKFTHLGGISEAKLK